LNQNIRRFKAVCTKHSTGKMQRAAGPFFYVWKK